MFLSVKSGDLSLWEQIVWSFGDAGDIFGFLWIFRCLRRWTINFRFLGLDLRGVRPAVGEEEVIRAGDDRSRFGGSDGQVVVCGGGVPAGEDWRNPTGERLQKLLCPL